ncbi:hypothetical protein GZ77_23200 [Endozoicomonas montiporae]|uniref:Uncharacterized protein n=2 Tax=Endozoicomonas montiporae TaxID=1027273 RepID=A0A081N0M7_9GAMM|nr:hypothetical protein [Endozoicomonas montiporae]AMO54471.1 hypothetical protein EZMO1_0205 [Endozoicomonas montiporae CL-33]KEQ12000.1 hypothetical protein GZ77_23200 [Endozoicomonas montiporae]
MPSVRTKLENALQALKQENKKINPSAVEKRAGVANGSLKNHPMLKEMILAEKARQQQLNPDVSPVTKDQRKQVSKEKYNVLEARNGKLKAENSQFQAEMREMADSIAQLTWELHRYKTATRKDSPNVHKIKV